MICKFCGNVIDDNSDFCFICGQKNPAEEASAPAVTEENNDIFSQAPVAESAAPQAPAFTVQQTVPVAPEAAVLDEGASAPVYAQSAPIYAQSAPVYAQQAIIQQVAPAQIIKTKTADASVASKGSKIFAVIFSALFILQFIPWIWYSKAKKAGYEQKSIDLLNSIMIGLCIFMAVLGVFFIKSFML
ncbi:MAG: hypothetical protein IJN88_09180 [Clostridia bacterium]|nr:hypothetical protein [Clostridia bacterium]